MQETEITNTTTNILCILKKEGLVKLKKNQDRSSCKLDKVFEDLKKLASQDIVKVYESTVGPYEMIVVSKETPFKNSFII